MKEVNEKEKKKTTTRKKTNNKKKDINKDREIEVEKVEEVVKEESINKVNKQAKNTTTFNLVEVIIIMIITAVFGVLVGSCVAYFRENIVEEENPDAFDEFMNVYEDIVSEYYFDVDEEKLIEAGIKGMVDYLGDPYSSYLDYADTTSLDLSLEGEYVGMGATITVHEKGYVYISEIFKDSPAEKAGFEIGDIIVRVDDEDVTAQNSFEISEKVKGVEGTTVNIKILRNGEEKVIELVRGKVEIPSVSYRVVENTNIGFIKIDVFAKNTPDQFKRAMDELVGAGIDSVIIDVRDNSGGYLTSAESIASYFLDKEDVIYQLDTKGLVAKVRNTSEKLYDVEVVLLTNGYSASASEILASSLKENIDAIIVGEKTYGKGTVQKAVKLSSGAMVKYTVQEWYTPNGNKINGVGVIPDYEISLDEKYNDDPVDMNDNQLQKAIEILKK